MRDLERQLKNYRLTTAEILYHLPDAPHLLQSFVWQEYDIAPRFPELHKFLDFWTHELDGAGRPPGPDRRAALPPCVAGAALGGLSAPGMSRDAVPRRSLRRAGALRSRTYACRRELANWRRGC